MGNVVNPIKKAAVKKSLLAGNGYKEAMLTNGYALGTANTGKDASVIREALNEIQQESLKRGLVSKAWKALEDNLEAEKASDRNTAATAILDFTEGKKAEVTNKNPEKIVISYVNTQHSQTNRLIEQEKMRENIQEASKVDKLEGVKSEDVPPSTLEGKI